MELIDGLFRWLFIETIYGSGAVAFGLGYIASRIFVRHKEVAAGLAGLTGFLGTMATGFYLGVQDKYEFSRQTLSLLDKTPWMVVVNKSSQVEFYEIPFVSMDQPPITSFHLVMANTEGEFDDTILRYGQPEKYRMASPDCEDPDRLISYTYANKDGSLYRKGNEYPVRMSDEDFALYCEYDWTPHINAYIDASVALEENDADKVKVRKYLEWRMLLPRTKIKQKE